MSGAPLFWFFWSLGLPALIGAGAYVAVRLHERGLRR
jgi:hypothetical protein